MLFFLLLSYQICYLTYMLKSETGLLNSLRRILNRNALFIQANYLSWEFEGIISTRKKHNQNNLI